MTPPPQRFAWDWVGGWTLVFVANLPVPLLASWGAVQQGSGVGLFGGVVMLYLLGAAVCGLRWRVGRSLVWGGAVVALTQFFPFLQVGSGILAVMVWDGITGASSFAGGIDPEGPDERGLVRANFGVCAVVFLTAQPLLVVALLVGAGLRAMRGDAPIWFTRSTNP